MLSVLQEGIIWVFGMIRSGIEHRYPGPLANILLITVTSAHIPDATHGHFFKTVFSEFEFKIFLLLD